MDVMGEKVRLYITISGIKPKSGFVKFNAYLKVLPKTSGGYYG
jgi:hypothetical protein